MDPVLQVHLIPQSEFKDLCNEEQTMFPVVNSDNTYQGFITIKDIDSCENAVTAWDVLDFVGKVGERDIYVYDTDSVEAAKSKLRERKLQFIPVIDHTRHYQGTIDREST